MKKLFTILIVIITILSITSIVNASQFETKLKVNNVTYDKVNYTYNINLIDKDGETWIIALFENTKLSKKLLSNLQTTFKNALINVTFENYDNKNLYDDEILNWYVID